MKGTQAGKEGPFLWTRAVGQRTHAPQLLPSPRGRFVGMRLPAVSEHVGSTGERGCQRFPAHGGDGHGPGTFQSPSGPRARVWAGALGPGLELPVTQAPPGAGAP